MASDSESPDMKMLRRMVWDELDNALTELPSEQREAILLTEITKTIWQQRNINVSIVSFELTTKRILNHSWDVFGVGT